MQKTSMFLGLAVGVACLEGSSARGDYTLYDDFTWPNTTLDRTKWWRGGLAGVDGANAILNESDLTSAVMFSEGDFKFVIGGPSASSQGLFGLGDIDDGDPFLVLSDNGPGWRFHVRNGSETYTGPVVAASLSKGDVVVFHWDVRGSSVSINGAAKDAQTVAHPPCMPLTLLEWNNSGTNGQLVVDSLRQARLVAGSADRTGGAGPQREPRLGHGDVPGFARGHGPGRDHRLCGFRRRQLHLRKPGPIAGGSAVQHVRDAGRQPSAVPGPAGPAVRVRAE